MVIDDATSISDNDSGEWTARLLDTDFPGAELVLRFCPSGLEVFELEAVECTSIEPRWLQIAASRIHSYLEYATSVHQLDPSARSSKATAGIDAALDRLRALGRTKKALPDDFFRLVATQVLELQASGEVYVNKSLALRRRVNKSTAGRWIAECVSRNFLVERGRGSWEAGSRLVNTGAH